MPPHLRPPISSQQQKTGYICFRPKANRMVIEGHNAYVNAFANLTDEGLMEGADNLPALTWADRVTARTSTGWTAYYLNCGQGGVLLIEMIHSVWSVLLCDQTYSTEELLAMQTLQLQQRERGSSVVSTAFHRTLEGRL